MRAFLRIAAAALVLAWLPSPASSQERARPKPTNVILTFHIIEADGFQGDDAEIQPIVTELRRIFRFKGYRLVSKSVLVGTAYPSSRVSQQIATDSQDRVFTIEADVNGDGAGLVRMSVSLTSHVQTSIGPRQGSTARLIDASVNLTDGKTVVLGSSRQAGESAAIILAVTPQISQ